MTQSTGTNATADWLKMLPERGKQRMKDCARWEVYEMKGGFTYLFPLPEEWMPYHKRMESIISDKPYEHEHTGNDAMRNSYHVYSSSTCKKISLTYYFAIYFFLRRDLLYQRFGAVN